MGVVYLAEGPLGRLAVKVVRSDLADDPEFRVRFQREVQSSFRLSGRATAKLIDFDLTGERPWFATEFLDAPDLGLLVAVDGPLDPPRQLAFAAGLVEGLVALHESELVHRDLKPTNVICTADGPKLIDFGISTVLGSSRLTATGQLLGTPAWMAPEQISNGETSAASDVFAWACVVAFAASGRTPFGDGAPSAVAVRVLTSEPDIDDSGLAPPLRGLVRRALDKDPAARPSVHDLQRALDEARSDREATLAGAAPAVLPTQRTDAPTDPPTQRTDAPADPPTRVDGPPFTPFPPSSPTPPHPSPGPLGRRRAPLAWGAAALAALLVAGVTAVVLVGGSDDPSGSGTTSSAPGTPGEPADVAFADGAVWFTAGPTIRRSDAEGVRTVVEGGNPRALDSGPGSVYYVDTEANRVRNVSFTGQRGTADVALTGGPLDTSTGARHIVDASGRFFYVLDAGRVTRYDLDGGNPVVVGGGGTEGDGPAASTDLSGAVGIEAVATNGVEEIYVLQSQSLRRISQGEITTVRTFDLNTDGFGGFVFDPDTKALLLLDRDNGQVVSVDEQGTPSVVAGAASGAGDPDGTEAATLDLGDLVGINYAPNGFVVVDRLENQPTRALRVDTSAGTVAPVATD
jgi:hypothetical protein